MSPKMDEEERQSLTIAALVAGTGPAPAFRGVRENAEE